MPDEWTRDLDKPSFQRRESVERLSAINRGELVMTLPTEESPPVVEETDTPVMEIQQYPLVKLPTPYGLLSWSRAEPTQAGLYWIRDDADGLLKMAVVEMFGGRLSIREIGKGDSCLYRGVGFFRREWAGPVPVPEDVTNDILLERLA